MGKDFIHLNRKKQEVAHIFARPNSGIRRVISTLRQEATLTCRYSKEGVRQIEV